MACKGSGRTVSGARQRSAIFVNGAWRARCPVCDRTASFVLAESRRDGMGYVRRYVSHGEG